MAKKFIQEAITGVDIASKAKLVALIGILTEKYFHAAALMAGL